MEKTMKLYYHPTIENYACDIDGNIYSSYIRLPFKGWIGSDKYHLHKTNLSNGYSRFYARIPSGKRKQILCHQFVFECVTSKVYHFGVKSKDLVINHKNSIRNDNRFTNLELITARKNNTIVNKRTKHNLPRGVYYISTGNRAKRYIVIVYIVDKLVYFGYYLTQEEAYQVSKRVYKQYFNEDI
jgi:hypothetical protein